MSNPEEMETDRAGDLRIFEELLLLALRDRKGTMRSGSWPDLALAGAVLSELALQEAIELEQKRRRSVVIPRGGEGLEHPLAIRALERMTEARRPISAQSWVTRLAGMKRLREEAAGRLLERGVLRREEDRILLVFRRLRFPQEDSAPQDAVVERVRRAIRSEGNVDVRTASLVGIASVTNLLQPFFERKELRQRRRRIKAIVEANPAAVAANEAVKAVQAAIIASTAAASTAAASAASSSS